MAAAVYSAGRELPRWLLPTGIALGLGRAGAHLAGVDAGAALLALVAEPTAALAAAGIFQRQVVPQRVSPLYRLIAPLLLLVGGLEAWDALRDLSIGPAQVLWVPWVVVAGPLAAILIIATLDEARMEGVIAQDALRASERRYRALTDHAVDLICELDGDGRFAYVNPAFEEVLGWAPEELLGHQAWEFTTSEEGAKLAPRFPRASSDHRARWHTIQYRRKDGTWAWFEATGKGYVNADGEIRVVGIGRDIAERMKAQEERLQLETKMQQAQKLESLGVLAGGIAHDFNNLLVGILGNAELALGDLERKSPVRSLIEDISQASERAAELTHQLLAYAGKAEAVLQTIDLGTLLREMVQLLRTGLPRTAEFRMELQEEEIWIHADPSQIRQVVMNLLTNAADSLEGQPGVVTVGAGVRHLGQRDLERSSFAQDLRAGDYAYAEVHDTGRGIAAEDLSKIFDPFFTTKFTGRGLGLAAVLGIVRRHRGAVRVESDPSHGTRFQIFLPLVEESPPSELVLPVRSEWRAQGIVLVVDDEEMVRAVAARVLEKLGFRVLSASGGPEALELFSENARDVSCVLLDLTMPSMNGEEVFVALREIRGDIPVIFMSGHSSRELDSRLLRKTAVSRLRKPFQRDALVRGLREVLDQASQESTTAELL